jgi:hypothetical protein
MRAIIALGLLSLLTACSGKPADYGITGPGNSPPPTVVVGPTPDSSAIPGVTTTGPGYGPSNRPSSGSVGFWGYN